MFPNTDFKDFDNLDIYLDMIVEINNVLLNSNIFTPPVICLDSNLTEKERNNINSFIEKANCN